MKNYVKNKFTAYFYCKGIVNPQTFLIVKELFLRDILPKVSMINDRIMSQNELMNVTLN